MTARRQMRLPWHAELVVDSFAGGGGASIGIEQALGRAPDIAINHDAIAIGMHQANHPDTRHLHTDVWDIDPCVATQGRPVGLAWFSPDCRHFSKAKGGALVSRKVRSLAWVVVRWARAVRPRCIILENVEEFSTWGPLGDDGRPCPRRRGQTYRRWWRALERLGYRVEARALVAADYGAPTTRRRLYLVARCDGEPIAWPTPTHGPGLQPFRPAAGIIDWQIGVPSIFGRARPLVEATQRRIARGLRRYVLEHRQPYIVRQRDARGAPFLIGIDHQRGGDYAAWPCGEPLTTVTTENRHALVAAWMVQHNGGMTGHDLRAPVSTITTTGSHQQLAVAGLDGVARPPMVRAWLAKYYGTAVGQPLAEPLHTVTTCDRFGLVAAAGRECQISDIGMRMLSARELFRAQGFPDRYAIDVTVGGRSLSKRDQVRLAGNSVCPPLAEAIVRANIGEQASEAAA